MFDADILNVRVNEQPLSQSLGSKMLEVTEKVTNALISVKMLTAIFLISITIIIGGFTALNNKIDESNKLIRENIHRLELAFQTHEHNHLQRVPHLGFNDRDTRE